MSDNMKMPEGVVNAIVHDVGGLVAAVWQDFFHGVPHGNAVGNISEHGQVIGAVSDDVTVLQRNLEPVHQKLDSGGLGAGCLDHFKHTVSPVNGCEFSLAVGLKGIHLAGLFWEDKKFVEDKRFVHGNMGETVFLKIAQKDLIFPVRRGIFRVIVEIIIAFIENGNIPCAKVFHHFPADLVRKRVGQKLFAVVINKGSASGDIAVKRKSTDIFVHGDKSTSCIDKEKMTICAGLLQSSTGALRNKVGLVLCDCSIYIEKDHFSAHKRTSWNFLVVV